MSIAKVTIQKYFVEKCRANINDSDSFGRTPIMQARSVEIVTYLLSKKADVSMTDCRNTTVLMYLLENLHRRGNGLFDIFDQVLSLGANILTVNFRKKTAADILMKNERYFPVSFVSALNLILTEAETIKRQYLSVFGENARINLKLKRGSFISLCTFCANEKTSFHKHMNTDDIQKMFCWKFFHHWLLFESNSIKNFKQKKNLKKGMYIKSQIKYPRFSFFRIYD